MFSLTIMADDDRDETHDNHDNFFVVNTEIFALKFRATSQIEKKKGEKLILDFFFNHGGRLET